ncbi:Uma2 family endonuclease [Archangium gephyra]|uniref:Uma2 family endonuclease n=1 Tax=Archangium gephyra TaxID=48 RepID=UPI0035D45F2E
MGERQPRKASYSDLEALPAHLTGELIDGELYASPPPALAYAVAAAELFGELSGPYVKGRRGPGGWRLLNEPELRLGGNVLVPDIAGWRRERMPRTPRSASSTLAPDWVCEVISPSTRALDRKAKLPVYARTGVRHVWLVDPDAHTLEVLRLEGAHYRARPLSGELLVRAEPFEALELELALLWEE